VIRRNLNRRHMTGDHHSGMAGRATLLVRATDGILSTHRLGISIHTASNSGMLPIAVGASLLLRPRCRAAACRVVCEAQEHPGRAGNASSSPSRNYPYFSGFIFLEIFC
jgi:hypothetical protein